MDGKLLNSGLDYGIAGFVIICLLYALNKLHNADTTQNSELIKQHAEERKQWHDDIQSLTKALTELTAKLPIFCGERRYKPPTKLPTGNDD